ncbi:uncharacterized protein PHALS_13680 [Plasmopara halstedii]|uniref:RxLR-like protein n=1 Tax=Plasmopara halstedii TaxID=4781 RepID=A0A0P1APL6_PLAHL|nr:uncharacterized protein PHALS_13680 [Plasmopara halstedii]CEG43487.1 hypothetical protein PHALS_13680 [Plasmopara halstedii]|eukprot:XP_024579856.1 hypothetical protein PHALS_13680 [Plasmopara halstedii]
MVKVSSLLMLPVLAIAQQQATSNDVLITMPVTIDGTLKNLQLLKGESFEDAAISFARSNGLMAATDDAQIRAVIDQLSGLLKDKLHDMETEEQLLSQPSEPMPTVQLSVPITIDDYSGNLFKYETDTPEAAVERFLGTSGFNLDVMEKVYPQLLSLVKQKLEELQLSKKELFSLKLLLDGREIIVRHFEDGIPINEAMDTLRGIGVDDGEYMDKVAPQIASQIVNEIHRKQSITDATEQQVEKQVIPEQLLQRRELFSEQMTLNNQPVVLVHYDGDTAQETAVRFLSENGITDDAKAESMMAQLVGIIDSRLAELLSKETHALARPSAQAQAEQNIQASAKQQSELLVTIPISLDEQHQAELNYFKGEDIETTVQQFLVDVGLGKSEKFSDNVIQLSALLRERVASLPIHETTYLPHATLTEALFSIPVSLSGIVYHLDYYENEDPHYAANSFCMEKLEIVREKLGKEFQLGGKSPTKSETLQTEFESVANDVADSQDLLLFTLDIDMGDGTSIKLPVHRNDKPQELASAFCTEHKLDQENVPALVEAMELQMNDL